jgi:hypothetical protein
MVLSAAMSPLPPMSVRRPCPPAPGPLEAYAQRGFRDYLQGLPLPRDRNKTLTGLAGTEAITGAQHREVQRLQWFLSESSWDHEVVNERRVGCCARTRPPPRTMPARWWSTTLATARTAPEPRTWPAST